MAQVGVLAAYTLGGALVAAEVRHYAQETLSAKTVHDGVDYYHVAGSAGAPLAVASAFDIGLPGDRHVWLRYAFDNLVLREGVALTPPRIALADGTEYSAAPVTAFFAERDAAAFVFAIPSGTTLAAGWSAKLGLDAALAIAPGAAGTVTVRVYLSPAAARQGTDSHVSETSLTLARLVKALTVRVAPRPPAIASVDKDYLSFTTGDSAALADVVVAVTKTVATGTADEAKVLHAATGAPLTDADVLGTVTATFRGDFSIGTFSLVARDAPCPPRYDGLTLHDADGRALGADDDPADAVKAVGTIAAAGTRSFCINVAGNTVPITPRRYSAQLSVVLALGADAPFTPTFDAPMAVSPVRGPTRNPPPEIAPKDLPPTVRHGAAAARYVAVETLRPGLSLLEQYYDVEVALQARTTFATPVADGKQAYLLYTLDDMAFTDPSPSRPPRLAVASSGGAASTAPAIRRITRRSAEYRVTGPLPAGWTATLELGGAVAVRPGDSGATVALFQDEPPHYTGVGLYAERHASTLVRTVPALVATVTPRPAAVAVVADWFASFASGDAAVLADVDVRVRDAISVGAGGEPSTGGATRPILDAADGAPVQPDDVLGRMTAEFVGDFSFGAFSLVPADQPCPAGADGLRLRAESGRYLRAGDDRAQAASAVGSMREQGAYSFCVNVAANERPIAPNAYTAALVPEPANRDAPPQSSAPAKRPSGVIVRDGATVFLPTLDTSPQRSQRVVIVNRLSRAAPYKLDEFLAPAGGTAGPGAHAHGAVPPRGSVVLPTARLVVVAPGSRAAASLMLDASPSDIQVLTTVTSGATGATDTVLHAPASNVPEP